MKQTKYSEIPEKEKGEILKKSIRASNKEQKELVDGYEWERRFNDEFDIYDNASIFNEWFEAEDMKKYYDEIKQFISNLLKEQQEKHKKEIISIKNAIDRDDWFKVIAIFEQYIK